MPIKKVGPTQFEKEPHQVEFKASPGATVSSGFTPKTERMWKLYEEILVNIRELKRSHYPSGGSVSDPAQQQDQHVRNLDFPNSLFFERGTVSADTEFKPNT